MTLFLLALMLAQKPSTPAQVRKKAQHARVSLVQWWKKDDFLKELSLSEDQKKQLSSRMEREQLLAQVLKTKIKKAKRQIQKYYQNPELTEEAARKHLENNLFPLLKEQEYQRMQTRFFVKNLLTVEQLSSLKEKHPLFFGVRWFKGSRIPVMMPEVQGKKDEKP